MLPLYLIKRCFEETVFRTLRFKQLFFKATFFKDIFLWIFNLEQKIILCLQNMALIKFFNCPKKNSLQPHSNDSTNKSLFCGHYLFGNTLFIIHFLVSVADCGYVHFSSSYLSKNDAVKLSFALFMFYYNIIIIVSCWPSIKLNTSQIFFCYTDSFK